MRILSKTVRERLTATYIFALSLVALLTVSSQVVIRNALEVQANDSGIINIAGRQRMLSQRITKEAIILQLTADKTVYAGRLERFRETVALWKRAHHGLQHGDKDMGLPGVNSDTVTTMFAALEPSFQKMLKASQDIINTPPDGSISRFVPDILANENRFLEQMNRITFQYDHEAGLRVKSLKKTELALMLATLFMLLLEAFFVFRPVARKMGKYLIEVTEANRLLLQMNRKMARIEKEKVEAREKLIGELRANEVLQSQINFNLEDLVKKRTAEIESAMHMVEQANLSKSRFVANMSHELRTPLNAIIGYSEILIEDAEEMEEPEFVRDVRNIQSAGKHLLGLVNDILDISKIEAGKIEIFPERFDLQEMLNDVLSTAKPLMSRKDNILHVNFKTGTGEVKTDLTKLRQILLNLLSNAAKFTEQGNIHLSIERIKQSSGDKLRFQVADDGIGMNEAQMNRLFQAFSQADPSTTRKYGGTGLGLAISKYFVEMMGGTVSVQSQKGKGSIFTIELPAEIEKSSEAQLQIAACPPPEPLENFELIENENSAGPVLVVDGDSSSRDLMQTYITTLGYTAHTASSIEDGLLLAHEIKPEMIILDVVMKGIPGMLSWLKKEPELADTPVIMASEFADEDVGYALGAADYLIKPVSRKQLDNVLKKHGNQSMVPNLLIVDDDPMNRDMMKQSLKKTGWRVRQAANGEMALGLLKQKIPDLILLDLMMPEMDGFEFMEALSKKDEWKDIPVVVITSKELTGTEYRRLEKHARRVFQKGAYQKDGLLAEVRELLHAYLEQNKTLTASG